MTRGALLIGCKPEHFHQASPRWEVIICYQLLRKNLRGVLLNQAKGQSIPASCSHNGQRVALGKSTSGTSICNSQKLLFRTILPLVIEGLHCHHGKQQVIAFYHPLISLVLKKKMVSKLVAITRACGNMENFPLLILNLPAPNLLPTLPRGMLPINCYVVFLIFSGDALPSILRHSNVQP